LKSDNSVTVADIEWYIYRPRVPGCSQIYEIINRSSKLSLIIGR